jgi:hypothetical protein
VSGFREEEMGVVMADGALPWTAPVRLPFHLTYYYRRKKENMFALAETVVHS